MGHHQPPPPRTFHKLSPSDREGHGGVSIYGSSIPSTLRIPGSLVHQDALWLCQAHRWPGVGFQTLREPTYHFLAQVRPFGRQNRMAITVQLLLGQIELSFWPTKTRSKTTSRNTRTYSNHVSHTPNLSWRGQTQIIYLKPMSFQKLWCMAPCILFPISFYSSGKSEPGRTLGRYWDTPEKPFFRFFY